MPPSSTPPASAAPPPLPSEHPPSSRRWKSVALVGLLTLAVIGYVQFRDEITLHALAQREATLRDLLEHRALLVYASAFVIYTAITSLFPGAVMLSLFCGWYFGFARGTLLVSFASTTGATFAFLISRFLFRDAIQHRFGDRLERVNASFQRDGAYYLFTMRLIPAIPFFAINTLMGLTPIRTRTFWWVSQIGMLPGTMAYLYAGSVVPSLETLADQGIQAAFSPSQLTRMFAAFAILSLLPWAARQITQRIGQSPD